MSVSEPRALASHRLKRLLTLLLVVGVAGILFRKSIQDAVLLRSLLMSSSPAEAAFRELADRTSDPFVLVQKVWATEKIPHRALVAGYLKDQAVTNPELLKRAEPLLMSAVMDADLSVRELALGALAQQKSPELFRLSAELLRDVDPEIRLLGLQYLRKQDAAKGLPTVFRLLDDPEPRVVASADSALRNWTKQDFGIRVAQTISIPAEGGNPSLDSENLKILKDGVQHWKEWWTTHRSDYPPGESSVSAHLSAPQRLPLTEFALKDLNGKTVRAADLKGRVVLLNFWTTWCPACLVEIPDLIELQKRNAGRLVILGISLDGQTEVDEHGHSADAHHGEERESRNRAKTGETELRAKVSGFARDKGVNYTILPDPTSDVGSGFNGGELPTNVLVDPEGFVRRRFLGGRTVAVFERMIDELAPRSSVDR